MRRQKAKGKRQKELSARATPSGLPHYVIAFSTFAFCLFTFAFFSAAQKETEESPARAATFHRWGAVTLFHGLPSDRVRAVEQDAEGLMWFGTDAGLARYDGRRTQTISDEGLASRRITALRSDEEGALWIGTDAGASLRTPAGEFRLVAETKGRSVAAIITPARGRAVLATSDGFLFDCRRKEDGSYSVEQLAERILPTQGGAAASSSAPASAAANRQPLELTSLAAFGETILVGTRGRGLVAIERGGVVREVAMRPRAFYVEALEQTAAGRVHLGAQTSHSDSGLFRIESDAARAGDASPVRAVKVAGEATGTVTSLRSDPRGGLYVGTDGRGVLRFGDEGQVERFTFAGTAGALRSDRVYSVFIDREGVAWFGTDRGVCRYDPRGLRVENVSDEREANFIRTLYRTSSGVLLCGTNRGLFVRDQTAPAWRHVEALGKRTVYTIAEDRRGRVLVGAAGGLYASLPPGRTGAPGVIRFAPEESTVERKEEKKEEGAETQDAPKTEAQADVAGIAEALPATPSPEVEQDKADASEDKAEKTTASKPTASPVVSGNVRAVAVFDGSTYVSVFGRGVERLDEDFRRTPVWPRAGETDARGRETVSLHADERGARLWIGTANAGVFHFDGQGVRADPAHEPLGRRTVYGVSASGGWLWLATNRGLYAQGPGGPLAEIVPDVDARGVVAVAAAQTNDKQHASQTSPPPQAWCATAGGGVIKVLLDEQFGNVTARLDAEQGLPSQSAFAVMSLEAQGPGVGPVLLIGTTRGLALYEPGGAPPVLRPTRLTASRPLPLEELQREGGLELAYPQNGLVLDVAATSSRTFPEQFQYAFLLHDASGKVTKRKLSHDSQFQVESLKPGRYRVTARAFTIDLAPSAPFSFEFVVTKAPFPWTTAALSVLLSLALVALVWGYVQHRKIVRSGAELFEANRQLAAARLQLANEAESERRRIARDLHDQTLADLRRLLLLADEMQAEAATLSTDGPQAVAAGADGGARMTGMALDPTVLRAEIESVSQEIRRICEDLSPSVLENVGFAAALEWALAERVAHMPPDCKFTYDFVCDDTLEERLHFAPGVQMQIYRIVQEAVSNVCRHAQATRVRLSVRVTEGDDFLLTLEDDGHGFEPKNKKAKTGRGLANIRARASLIEAEVNWTRRDGGSGTVFVLKKSAARSVNSAATV